MTVYINPNGSYEIRGVSADTKPVGSAPDGSVFWEQDTDKKYYYDEATRNWAKIGSGATPTPVTPVQVTVNIPAAEAQADSTATTIAQLETDFNALLAKLQAAGLMEVPEEPEEPEDNG